MSTKQSTLPKSLKDAGYRFALNGETTESLARYVLDVCPSFLDDVPSEVRADLYAGFQLRKHELTGSKFYKVGEAGTLIPLADPKGQTNIVELTINSAMSYSSQEFGKLRETDPARHEKIGVLRTAFSTYASNNMKALRKAMHDVLNGGKPRERAANKGFVEAMQKVFEAYEKRVKTAKERGDQDSDPVKYKLAVQSFWATYNK